MNDIAVAILLFLSSVLGVENHPTPPPDWQIVNQWDKTTEGYFLFSAASVDIVDTCQQNPSYYLEFPFTIHSASQVIVNNQVIATTSSPDFQHTRGFYGALIIPCYQLKDATGALTWEVLSYSEYFAWFKYFPKVVSNYPKVNFFNETLNVIAGGVLLILCFLYLILFAGKIPKTKLLVLIASNFFTAIYFIGNTAAFFGVSISMLFAHKIADAGLWIGLMFFIHALYLEGLVLRWMNYAYKISVLIALGIILTSPTGDAVQLGTSIPFLFTIAFPGYAIIKLLKKGKLKSRKEYIQLIALFMAFFVYWNDIFVVTGVINFFPLLPLGIPGSYIFILLSVNESIVKTYMERDELKVLTEKLQQANENLHKTQNQLINSEKMAVMGRAVARIAHELNTPIYSARSASQNIQAQTSKFLDFLDSDNQQQLPAKLTQYRDDLNSMDKILHTSLFRAAELVRNFKQISVDQVNVKKKDFLLLDYIKTSLMTMETLLKRKNINVHLHGDEVRLYHDPSLFYQLINNLVSNVEKYAYQTGGDIDIKIEDLKNCVIITFTDYGKGISEENISKIFDPFYTTGGGQGGLGLGLNIVYGIVENKLRGEIICSSTEEKGTTFIITIPTQRTTEGRE